MDRISLTRFPIEGQRVHHSAPAAKGKAAGLPDPAGGDDMQGGAQKQPDLIADDLLLQANEWGGHLAAMGSEETEDVLPVPNRDQMGEYLLVFDLLDDSPASDVSMSAGTVFSVLASPEGRRVPHVINTCLRPGRGQGAAGYAIYGRSTMRALSVGTGTYRFTLNREFGAGALTHTNIRIRPDSRALPMAGDGPRVAADHATWQA